MSSRPHPARGLAEDVLDHRLNSRTVYMNPVIRFIYWNMNYHVEHHMFPMVPYHALPGCTSEMKGDFPAALSRPGAAYREIIPALFSSGRTRATSSGTSCRRPWRRASRAGQRRPDAADQGARHERHDGWIEVCATDVIDAEDVIRFDHGARTFADLSLAR